jgi:hypothetical protein
VTRKERILITTMNTVKMHSDRMRINKLASTKAMQYSEQRLPDGQRVRYGDTSGIQSMQYGLSNHIVAIEGP